VVVQVADRRLTNGANICALEWVMYQTVKSNWIFYVGRVGGNIIFGSDGKEGSRYGG